jgi:Cupredoxin-like domain
MLTAASVAAQSPAPDRSTAPDPSPMTDQPAARLAWPTGDELRRELQEIGFVFRIDGTTGDWLGWTPPASLDDLPAMVLDGAGTDPAIATFDFQLIEGDPSLPLTAYLEVASRLPLEPRDTDRARRFIVDDLLEAPPETLEPCYVTDWERGVVLVTVDTETTTAHARVAPDLDALGAVDPIDSADPADCAPLVPSEIAALLGDPSSERVTIVMDGQGAFEPAEVTLTGALVTVVLTFRNGSTVEQSLTFEAPLDASTGPVEPGGTRLIVVRQLQPDRYRFFSDSAPDEVRGTLIILAPDAGQDVSD